MSDIPLSFLLDCSANSISEYQLRRLNEAANLRSKARDFFDEAIDREVEARVACFLRMNREEIIRLCSSIEMPTEEALRLWIRSHGKELLRIVAGDVPQLEETTGPKRE